MSRRRLGALVAFGVLTAASSAGAHVVVQRAGLRQLLQSSDAAVVVEFVSPLRIWSASDGSDRQEYFTVRTLETIAGVPTPVRFDVFPHAEGMPGWREGERALLFLERTEKRPEFAGLASRFPYFTIQEAGQEWALDGESGACVRDAAREYRRLLDAKGPEATAALRRLVAGNLRSGVSPLRADAVAELARAAKAPGFFETPADVAPFAAQVSVATNLPVTTRVALARLLDGAPGFDSRAALRGLAQSPLEPGERLELIRALGALDDPALSAWIATSLSSPDPALRREAAYALAWPWHAAQVAALARHLDDPDPGVARAVLRAIGALGTAQAASILEREAARDGSPLAPLAKAELRRAGGASARPGPGQGAGFP